MNFRKFLAAAATAATLCAATPALAYDEITGEPASGEAMVFDLFIVRPLSLAGAVVGTGVYIAALPINLITWNFAEPAKALVLNPLSYTFGRDLGDLR